IGKVFYYEVTGVDQAMGQGIHGTDIYVNGSHLGMAAVHCGALKVRQRGIVRVTILPNQANYTASTRNGITSGAYSGNLGTSFKVERVHAFAGMPKRQGARTAPLPAAVKEVLEQFEQEAAAIDKKIDAEVKKRCEKTAAEFKKVQDDFGKEAKLD